ncbi:MAG TPA: DUF2795 domain-containing protein [Thermomicrobiales bacterium]|nr:DUF2795 domain-containing protein [Thermomicrobiales bacterium]
MSKQNFRTPNPIEVQKNLKGISYPAQKDEVVRTARNNDAEDWIVQALERLPDQTFEAPTDVNAALSNAH